MANRYIDDKYLSSYNLEKIKKNVTILGNLGLALASLNSIND